MKPGKFDFVVGCGASLASSLTWVFLTAACLHRHFFFLLKGNILLEENKKLEQIKVIDFGMATYVKEDEKLTETMGTVAYMVRFFMFLFWSILNFFSPHLPLKGS